MREDNFFAKSKHGRPMLVITEENMISKPSKVLSLLLSPMVFYEALGCFLSSLPPGGRGTALAVEGACD